MAIPQADNALEVPGVYSNAVEVLSMNHIDVRIAFNEIAIESGNATRTIRRANVVMPTQAFLAMVQILEGNAQVLLAHVQRQAEGERARIQELINSNLEAARKAQEKP